MSLITYLKGTKAELAHVAWPTRRQTMLFTVLVVALSIITAALLGAFDSLFTTALKSFVVGR